MDQKGAFTSLLAPSTEKPLTEYRQTTKARARWSLFNTAEAYAIRDQLSLTTWLALGACLGTGFYILFGRLSFYLAAIVLAYRTFDQLLKSWGYKRNEYMDGVILNKFSAQAPNEDGTFGPKPASREITVFLIGAKCNHPLGLLAPGFYQLGKYFDSLSLSVEQNAKEYDFLGHSSWVSNSRSTNNELMSVMYFSSPAGLHKFAHDKAHRDVWKWWNATIKELPHLAIWHEAWVAPRGSWETIYVNSVPMLFGATAWERKTEAGTIWQSPVVDARRGVLKTSKGRMTRSGGEDHDTYEGDPYETYA